MRFTKYIGEARDSQMNKDLTDIIFLLLDKCQPALKALNGSTLYSGRNNKGFWYRKKPVLDRKPKDTDILIHKGFDEIFQKKFGYKARSESMFVTGSYRSARFYGDLYAIYPIGNFKFVWSDEITDLFSKIRDVANISDYLMYIEGMKKDWTVEAQKEWVKIQMKTDISLTKYVDDYIHKKENKLDTITASQTWIKEKVLEWMSKEGISQYQNTDLVGAVKSGNEIMLKCDEYVAIKVENYSVAAILQYFKANGFDKRTPEYINNWLGKKI